MIFLPFLSWPVVTDHDKWGQAVSDSRATGIEASYSNSAICTALSAAPFKS